MLNQRRYVSALASALALLVTSSAFGEILGPRLGASVTLNQVLSLLAQDRRDEADAHLRDFLVGELSILNLKTGQPILRSKLTPSQAQPLEASAKKLLVERKFASEARTVLGVVELLSGNRTAAETEFSQASKLNASYVTPRLCLALTHRLNGKTDDALRAYGQLIKLHPQMAAGHVGRAEAYYSSGNRAAAIKTLTDWKEGDPRNPEPANVLGLLYAAEGQYSLALAEFTSSLAVARGFSPAHTNRADVLLIQGKRAEALASYRAALEANRLYVPAYLRLGTVHAEAGEFKEALDVYNQAVAQGMPIAVFYNNAAWLTLRLNGSVDQALKLAERAVELDPLYADARGTLGWACLQKGDYDRAIMELRRAKDLAGDRPENTLHLGTAYYRKNLNDLALDELTKVVQAFPNTPEAAAARKLLEKIGR